MSSVTMLELRQNARGILKRLARGESLNQFVAAALTEA
jgi:hypothetical protein